jgi:SRSO17 transposase
MKKKVTSDKPLPELADYLSSFDKYFVRSEGRESLERYSTGLLSDIPRKNGATIEDSVPGTSYQRLQSLTTSIHWDEEGSDQERVEKMRDNVSLGDAVLIHDDTGNPKQGKHSVGVARQYCSELGKVANCQVVVTCHKPEIALALLDEANRMGIPHKAVVADASYGGNDTYLSGLEQRKEHYVNGVPCDFTVTLKDDPEEGIQRADVALRQIPKRKWPTIRWREGTKGWLRKKFVAVRSYRTLDGVRKTLGWLIGERPGYGQGKGDWKYYFSDFPVDTQLEKMVEYVHRRWHIDRFYEDAKNELGWGEYQGRKWVGFHRHTIIVMITYSFLAWREWKHRHSAPGPRGRPRNPFSPRRDRRRQSIQEIHRQVIDALWEMAVEHHVRN